MRRTEGEWRGANGFDFLSLLSIYPPSLDLHVLHASRCEQESPAAWLSFFASDAWKKAPEGKATSDVDHDVSWDYVSITFSPKLGLVS
jgi:hypothetical protein